MFDKYLPTIASSYNWFFYLGIFLFLSHLFLYGFGLDLSYFGLLLMWIGWAKPQLHTWFRWFLWIFIFLDVYANFRAIKDRVFKALRIYNGTPEGVPLEIQRQQLPINELNGTPPKGACPISNLHRHKPSKKNVTKKGDDKNGDNKKVDAKKGDAKKDNDENE